MAPSGEVRERRAHDPAEEPVLAVGRRDDEVVRAGDDEAILARLPA
jgi:hypothetical protein